MAKRGSAALGILLIISLFALGGLLWATAAPTGDVAVHFTVPTPMKKGISYAPVTAGNFSCWCPKGTCMVTNCMNEGEALQKCAPRLGIALELCSCNRLRSQPLIPAAITLPCK